MEQTGSDSNFEALAGEAREIWNAIAEWWDEYYGPDGQPTTQYYFHRPLR